MSESAEQQQRRYREFLELLPLTLSLAGLPASESGKYYNEDQIEARAMSIRHAYRIARQVTREAIKHSSSQTATA